MAFNKNSFSQLDSGVSFMLLDFLLFQDKLDWFHVSNQHETPCLLNVRMRHHTGLRHCTTVCRKKLIKMVKIDEGDSFINKL